MLTDLLFSFIWVFSFFFLAGILAWLLDRLMSFHLEGVERVRKIRERERERESELG